MQNHVMLDLETLGDTNDACIISIGAVRFNREGVLDRFRTGITPESAQHYGGKITAGTVTWWLDPERAAARDAFFSLEKVDLVSALEGFEMWYKDNGGSYPAPIWGNGATFDNVILRSAFKAIGADFPAPFWLDKCYRTVKGLAPEIKLERVGTHHDAADDAESQARHLIKIYEHLGIEL